MLRASSAARGRRRRPRRPYLHPLPEETMAAGTARTARRTTPPSQPGVRVCPECYDLPRWLRVRPAAGLGGAAVTAHYRRAACRRIHPGVDARRAAVPRGPAHRAPAPELDAAHAYADEHADLAPDAARALSVRAELCRAVMGDRP